MVMLGSIKGELLIMGCCRRHKWLAFLCSVRNAEKFW